MTTEEYQIKFPKMYTWVYGQLLNTHRKIPTVLEVLAYIMLMTGEDIEKLVELMKEMEKSNDQ